NASVATVADDGRVSAVGFGTTTIRASAGKSATATVVVARRPSGVSIFALKPLRAAPVVYVDDPIGTGYVLPLEAVAVDLGGTIVPGVSWSWSSMSPGAATVAQDGIVTATGLGFAAIRAATSDVAGAPLMGEYTVEVRPLV